MAGQQFGAGQLRDRVTFEAPVRTDDGYGGGTPSYEVRFKCWGRVFFPVGGEVVRAARLEGKQPVDIRARATSDTLSVDTSWRVRHRGKVYGITAAPPADSRSFINFTAVSEGSG